MSKEKNWVLNEQGQKVFTLTDPETGEVFEHVQVGRGRPPVYSPNNRARRRTSKASTPQRSLVTLSLVARDELPKAGSKAFFIPFEQYGDWETAVRHMQMVDVARTRGQKATVILDNKRKTVPVSQLVPMDVQLAPSP